MLAVTLTLALGAPTTDGTSRKALMFETVSPAERVPNQWGTMKTSLASNSMTWPSPDGKQHDTPFWGSFTPRVAAAAAFCAYRNTRLAIDGTWTTAHKVWCTEACTIVNDWGWVLVEEHQLYDSTSNDTDNADFWANGASGNSTGHGAGIMRKDKGEFGNIVYGPNCMLVMHGADLDTFEAAAQSDVYEESFGVEGVDQRWSGELDVLLDLLVRGHGNMTAMLNTCPGELYVAAHGMGGAVAQLFAWLANRDDDPLRMNKKVTKLHTFGSPPVANFPLTNEAWEEQGQPEGCFAGTHWYTRVPEGVFPDVKGDLVDVFNIVSGYPITEEVKGKLREHSVMKYLGPVHEMVDQGHSHHSKMRWQSLDMDDSAVLSQYERSAVLGPGLETPCLPCDLNTTTRQCVRVCHKFTGAHCEEQDLTDEEAAERHAMLNHEVPEPIKRVAEDPELAIRSADEALTEWTVLAHAHGHEWSHEIDINADPPMVKQDPINLHGPEAYMASLKEEIY